MSNYNLGNLISKFVNYQALQNKAHIIVQSQANNTSATIQNSVPQPQQSFSGSNISSETSQIMQMGSLSNSDTSVYIKELMKLPKNLNELIYIIQQNITLSKFNQQFASALNKNNLSPTQAQILAQLQNLSGDEANNILKNLNATALSQFQSAIKKLPINSNGLINLSDISLLIQANGKDAITKLITTMADAAKMGVGNLSQLKDTAKLINASIAAAAQNDNAQTMKLLMLLYLPWLPLQEGVGFDLEIETESNDDKADSILTITITTINYETVLATLILESSNSVHINIECTKDFPKEELHLRLERDEKHYSLQSVVSFDSSDKNKIQQPAEKQQAKINMGGTDKINPYLLLMAHAVIRHTLEIDKNKSDGIVSHIDGDLA